MKKIIKSSFIEVAGIQVEVVRKVIRHLRITVYPPDGRVRLAVPFWVGEEAIRLAVSERLAWIKGHREKFASQVRPPDREMMSDETHWFQGKKYSLAIQEVSGREGVVLKGLDTMELAIRAGSDVAHRGDVLDRWYRKQLKLEIAPLIAKWEPVLGVKTASWGVRKMKTRWGSCNVKAKRLWFNLELAKKTARMPRVCRRPRAGSSPGAAPRCAIQNAHDAPSSPMATDQETIEHVPPFLDDESDWSAMMIQRSRFLVRGTLLLMMGFLLVSASGADEASNLLAVYENQVPAWIACDPSTLSDDYKGLLTLFDERTRQATIKVPLDYADPARGDIEVAPAQGRCGGSTATPRRHPHQPGRAGR